MGEISVSRRESSLSEEHLVNSSFDRRKISANFPGFFGARKYLMENLKMSFLYSAAAPLIISSNMFFFCKYVCVYVNKRSHMFPKTEISSPN